MRLTCRADRVSLGCCLAVQGNLRDISRRSPASALGFFPVFRGAPEVPGLRGPVEEPAFDFPEALLALSIPKRH